MIARVGLAAGLAFACAGCVEYRPGITGTQSIDVALVTPANPGDINHGSAMTRR